MQPSCNKPWTRKFMVSAMSSSFMNKAYRDHIERLFFEKEQALLPATQPLVERIMEEESIRNRIRSLDEERRAFEARMKPLYDACYADLNHHNARVAAPEKERRQFIRRCGDGDCRGFLSTAWKCGLCHKQTCKECLVCKTPTEGDEEEEQHICNPDNVETAKLLLQDSKPCPKCATLIFKIDGCDQMWCTQCHTAFSWIRGTVETQIHNPHYYEWLRRQSANGEIPRQPGDGVCHNRALNQMIVPLYRNEVFDLPMYSRLSYMVRMVIHIREVEVPRFRVDPVLNNEQLRIKYMRGFINDAEFKKYLQRDHKKYEKNREIANILTLYVDTATDIIIRARTMMDQVSAEVSKNSPHRNRELRKSINDILDEVLLLVDYINECLEDVAKIYGCVYMYIEKAPGTRQEYLHLLSSGKNTKKAAAN